MEITRIDLTTFQSHTRSTFNLRRRNYFVGSNNAGKSSVIDAITWALTGRARGVDGTNHDVKDLIQDGAARLAVKLEIDRFGKIARETDGKKIYFKVKDWTGSNKAQQDELFQRLRITEDVLIACLDSAVFLNLHHHDAKRILFGVLDVRILAEALAPLGIQGPIALEELDTHYGRAFDQRTATKNLLEAHAIYPEPEGDEPPAAADLQAALDALREEERAMLGDGGEARGRHAELTRSIDGLINEETQLRARIDSYGDPNADLDAVEADIGRLPEPAKAADLFQEPAKPSKTSEDYTAVDTRLVDARGRLRMLDQTITAISGHEPARGCVLNAEIPCRTDLAEFTGKLEATNQEIKTLKSEIRTLESRQRGLQTQLTNEQNATRAKVTADAAARHQRDELTRRRHALTLKITGKQNDEARLDDVCRALAAKRSERDDLGDVAEPAGLAELQARIRRGEGIITEARAWHDAMRRHVESKDRRAGLEAEVARLEDRVFKLGPKGLVIDALEAARAKFETSVNAALSLFGYELAFQFDPWTVLVNGRKSIRLSESERLRVGVALQLAIASIAGVGFAAIDRVDMLDAENRAVLSDVIEAFDGQLLMAATKDPDYTAPAELPEDTAFFVLALEDAATRVLVSTD